MSSKPKLTFVEQPFADQHSLERISQMVWKHTTGNLDDPTATGRESFREVFVAPGCLKRSSRP